MVFGRSCALSKLPPVVLDFGGAQLQTVSTYKYLGLTLDAQLNYNAHICKIVSSVTSKLKQFQRMRNFLNAKAAIMVYKGMILPILEYGDIFFHAASAANRKRLQTLQNKGLWCALNKGFETSTADLHKDGSLLKIHLRREQHTLNFSYDLAQNPMNLRPASKLTENKILKKVLLRVKRPNTEKYKRSLAYIGPKKWNALPDRFHHTQAKSAYKSMVKDWIARKSILTPSSFIELTT